MASPVYIIPKPDTEFIEDRKTYAKKIIEELCKSAPIPKNASVVNGIGIIQSDYKFVILLDEAYKCFLLGLYHSTVSLCSVATERLCYDILEKSKVIFGDTELHNDQKKAFFRIPYSTLIPLLKESRLITEDIAKRMNQINDLRQRYVHPVLEGNPYEDAKKAMNILCAVITLYYTMKDDLKSRTVKED